MGTRQDLKDKYGRKLGYIEDRGNRKEIYDKYGRKLGYYDGKYTYDKYSRKIGQGDFLVTLLPKE